MSEAGEHGYHSGVDKYAAMKAVMKKHLSPGESIPDEPPLLPRGALGVKVMSHYAHLLDNMQVLAPKAAAVNSHATPAAETLGPECYYGLMVYRPTCPLLDASVVTHTSRILTEVQCALAFAYTRTVHRVSWLRYTATVGASAEAAAGSSLTISKGGLRDRVSIYLDGVYMGVIYRTQPTAAIAMTGIKPGSKLELVVENMVRKQQARGISPKMLNRHHLHTGLVHSLGGPNYGVYIARQSGSVACVTDVYGVMMSYGAE